MDINIRKTLCYSFLSFFMKLILLFIFNLPTLLYRCYSWALILKMHFLSYVKCFFNIFNHLMFMHSSVIKARTCTGIKMSHSNIATCVSHCEVCMPEDFDTSWHYGPCLCSWSRRDLSRLAHRGPNKIFSPLSGHTRTQLAETVTCRRHPADCDFF